MRFTSKNPSVASVTTGGNVTGVSTGNTVIEVTDDNNKYLGQIPTTVVANDGSYIPVTGITLSKTNVNLKYAYDFSKQLKATITPSSATNKAITWTSSNPAALSCVNGYLKCLQNGYGNFTVTASSVDGPVSTCNVNITRNGTVINSVSADITNLPDASERTINVTLDTTDLDGYKTGYTVMGDVGHVVISSRNDSDFEYVIPENTGEARTITIYVHGNFSGDTAKQIIITQPASRIVSGFLAHSEHRVVNNGVITGYETDVTYFTAEGGTSYRHVQNEQGIYISGDAMVHVRCAQSAFNDILANITSSDSWLYLRNGSYYDAGGWIYIAAQPNTTGQVRYAHLTFPGGLKYYVQQDA